jgi:IS5 family transposase
MTDQLGFADAFVDPRLGANDKLARIDARIDWSALASQLGDLRAAPTGRRPYPPLKMLKAIYLQALYDLSDPGLEAALLDRLSFRRFCGFALDETTPDETTILRFRADAAAAGVLAACFAEVNRQLENQGVILKKGTLVDATLIRAAHNPPPAAAGLGAPHPREPGADWTRKDGKALFGYKLHIGMDEGSGIVRRAVVTPAKTYESEVAEALITGDEKAVYGDRAYAKKARRRALRKAAIKDRILHRRPKPIAVLPHWQQVRNALIARRRAPVEAVFSALKRLYGQGRARCHSLARNAADLFACLTVDNLRRATLTGQRRRPTPSAA